MVLKITLIIKINMQVVQGEFILLIITWLETNIYNVEGKYKVAYKVYLSCM